MSQARRRGVSGSPERRSWRGIRSGQVFVIVAAVTANPSKAGGLDQAFRELLTMSGGPVLVFLAGLGLLIFAAYGFAEAKWHRT